MRTDDPRYPHKNNPLRFADVAYAAANRWRVQESAALKYLQATFTDPGDALTHLQQHLAGPPDAFWKSL